MGATKKAKGMFLNMPKDAKAEYLEPYKEMAQVLNNYFESRNHLGVEEKEILLEAISFISNPVLRIEGEDNHPISI